MYAIRSYYEVSVEDLNAVLGDDYRLVWDRTLGEFYLREMLGVTVPAETYDAAAAGWGGDRYRIYFNDATDETVLVYRAVWDRITSYNVCYTKLLRKIALRW